MFSLFVFEFLVNELLELGEDFVFSLGALLVVELGEGSLLISAVDLVLFTQSHGLHTSMSER